MTTTLVTPVVQFSKDRKPADLINFVLKWSCLCNLVRGLASDMTAISAFAELGLSYSTYTPDLTMSY